MNRVTPRTKGKQENEEKEIADTRQNTSEREEEKGERDKEREREIRGRSDIRTERKQHWEENGKSSREFAPAGRLVDTGRGSLQRQQ